MQRPLPVTPGAYNRALERLVFNFDPHLQSDKLAVLELEYRRVFYPEDPAADLVGGHQDALLERVIDRIIDTRTERGMPRVAELREILDPLYEGERLYRDGQAYLDRQREEERKRGIYRD